MRIGVVSDTHARPLPEAMLRDFQKVDLIIHAGDLCSWKDLETLAAIAEVKAVYGNMDDASIRSRLPADQIISCGRFKIGIYHGEGAPKTLLEKVRGHFGKYKVDAIVFGHSHEPFNQVIDGVLFFNPGSPNDKICAPYCAYGFLDVTDEGIAGRIVTLK